MEIVEVCGRQIQKLEDVGWTVDFVEMSVTDLQGRPSLPLPAKVLADTLSFGEFSFGYLGNPEVSRYVVELPIAECQLLKGNVKTARCDALATHRATAPGPRLLVARGRPPHGSVCVGFRIPCRGSADPDRAGRHRPGPRLSVARDRRSTALFRPWPTAARPPASILRME